MKETETVEFKKSTSELKESIISIVAILNKHQNGTAYFGIRDDGVTIGQDISDSTLREISKTISDHIEPKIFPKVQKLIIKNKACIKIAFHGKDIPYFAYGRAYVRTGTENKQISAKELENIILQKNKENLRWDNQICEKASLKDIDEEKLIAYLKKSALAYSSLKDSLERLEVFSGRGILNAGILLFSSRPSNFFRSAKLRCAVFPKQDSAIILDRKEFEDDILSLVQKAQEYILEHINMGMRVEGLYRIDVPEIDIEALRESIINAFCHRDYREYESVEVAIFKDRVEIRNPGGVFGDISLAQLLKGKAPTQRRNPLIADLFKRIHFGEKWGRGIKFILSKEPYTKFESSPNRFVTIFKRKVKGVENVPVNVPVNVPENRLMQVEQLLMKDNTITIIQIAKLLQVTQKTIKRDIVKLKESGKIKRIGPDKGGHWEIRK